MPFSNIDITLDSNQQASIQNALDDLLDVKNLPVQFNLTKAERTALQNIADERYPYVQRAIKNHGPLNPTLVSGFAGNQKEADNDLLFFDQMEKFIGRLRQIIEIYQDTQQVAGSEAYKWTRALYNTAKDAAANQVPGADAVADDLAPLFEQEDKGDTPPVNP